MKRNKLTIETTQLIKQIVGDSLRKSNLSIKEIKSVYKSLEKIETTSYTYMKIMRKKLEQKLKEQGKL